MQGRAAARSISAEEHWRLLAELDSLTLNDSCCEICHCDCYSSHRSSSDSDPLVCLAEVCEKIDISNKELSLCELNKKIKEKSKSQEKVKLPTTLQPRTTKTIDSFCCTSKDLNNSKKGSNRKTKNSSKRKLASEEQNLSNSYLPKPSSTHAIAKAIAAATVSIKSKSHKNTPTHAERASPLAPTTASACGAIPKRSSSLSVKRSKSVSSLRSRSPSPLIGHHSQARTGGAKRIHYNTRDCKILQELLSALTDDDDISANATLQVSGKNAMQQEHAKKTSAKLENNATDTNAVSQSHTLPRCAAKTKSDKDIENSSLTSQKLCASMASLCLAPTVREAYQQVPAHDKRILNRMAHKRSERAIAKENAWLARKYWENERYERELFKCAQMEEYKRAIHDKQFQDYLLTKARLNQIAQRDLAELQRLRDSLEQKDMSTKRRLEALRVERGIAACQRRCEELRRAEAVTVQQESQQIDEKLRKEELCTRLSERLQRAEQIRSEMLEGYLRRLRYDNYMEGLVHEEQWREAQQLERQRRTQLSEHIKQKREQSQRFIEARQRRKEVTAHRAKIAASLRELVRNSVTPDGGGGDVCTAGADGGVSGVGDAVSIANTATLSKVLLDRPYSKLSLQP